MDRSISRSRTSARLKKEMLEMPHFIQLPLCQWLAPPPQRAQPVSGPAASLRAKHTKPIVCYHRTSGLNKDGRCVSLPLTL